MRIVTGVVVGFGLLTAGCGPTDPFQEGTRAFAPPGEAQIPYGTQGSEDITGSVAAVPIGENEHVHDVIQMLRSHVPGLQVTELPNGEIRLRIRGDQQTLRTDDASNQPLLVIDDMPILPTSMRGALLGLNPRDVESIHVLKDVSSTAIYGSRGANGVILIRLKR